MGWLSGSYPRIAPERPAIEDKVRYRGREIRAQGPSSTWVKLFEPSGLRVKPFTLGLSTTNCFG